MKLSWSVGLEGSLARCRGICKAGILDLVDFRLLHKLQQQSEMEQVNQMCSSILKKVKKSAFTHNGGYLL